MPAWTGLACLLVVFGVLAYAHWLRFVFHRSSPRVSIDELTEETARHHPHDASVLRLSVDGYHRLGTDREEPWDTIVEAVATTCERALRREDIVAQTGAADLAVLLPETPLAGAVKVAERLQRRVAELAITVGGRTLRPTVSVGVASIRASDNSEKEVLARAEEALYRASERGRDSLVIERPAHRARLRLVHSAPGTTSSLDPGDGHDERPLVAAEGTSPLR
ncbi:MAG: GGDEF domain-containing protein [Myxococcota bacterium]